MQLSYRQKDLALSAILQCPSLGEDYSYAKLTNPFYDWFIMYVMDIIEHTLLPKCPINQPKQCHYISSDTCTVQRLYTLENLSDKFGNISSSNKLKILDVFGLKSWDTYEDINEHHKNRANNENLKIINLEKPLEVDEHSIHIEEHTKFIITDTKNTISKEFKDKLLNHIKQHKQHLSN
jgi:hypothetical protein